MHKDDIEQAGNHRDRASASRQCFIKDEVTAKFKPFKRSIAQTFQYDHGWQDFEHPARQHAVKSKVATEPGRIAMAKYKAFPVVFTFGKIKKRTGIPSTLVRNRMTMAVHQHHKISLRRKKHVVEAVDGNYDGSAAYDVQAMFARRKVNTEWCRCRTGKHGISTNPDEFENVRQWVTLQRKRIVLNVGVDRHSSMRIPIICH
ncbi:hypothetical protein SAMN05446635_4811 [Burkholderia sp. OK233]|nr:hypothetical protein SAMN05446635_4811 [Burkholderia sp. OK233]